GTLGTAALVGFGRAAPEPSASGAAVPSTALPMRADAGVRRPARTSGTSPEASPETAVERRITVTGTVVEFDPSTRPTERRPIPHARVRVLAYHGDPSSPDVVHEWPETDVDEDGRFAISVSEM